MVVNAVAFVVALTGLWRLVRRDFDPGVADRTVLYVAVFPVAFFLIAPFTESLFLAAAVWSILGARERRWGLVAVAGLLAGLTRPQGALLVLPLGWEAYRAIVAWRHAPLSRAEARTPDPPPWVPSPRRRRWWASRRSTATRRSSSATP